MAKKTLFFNDDFLKWLNLTGNDSELLPFDDDNNLYNGFTYDPDSPDPRDSDSTVGMTVDDLLETLYEDFESEYDVDLRNSEEDHWH